MDSYQGRGKPMMAAVSGGAAEKALITLPHDAMIHEQRTPSTKNQHQTGSQSHS